MAIYANTPWRQAQRQAAEESDFEDEVADDGSDHRSDTPICEWDSDTLDFESDDENEIMREAMELEIKDKPESRDEAVNDPYVTPASTSEQSSPREGRPSFNSPSSMLARPSEAIEAPGNMSLQVWANHRVCEANKNPSGDTIQQNPVLLAAKSKAVCTAASPFPPPLPPPKARPKRKPQYVPIPWVPHDGTCLERDATKLPPLYGEWDDWNCPVNLELEEMIAMENDLEWHHRGPNPSNANTAEFWNGLPFNYQKSVWGFSERSQLPEEYNQLTDWWSHETLEREAELAKRFRVPWNLRGPPDGPADGHWTWRGLHWRSGSKKWMNRKGEFIDDRRKKFGKARADVVTSCVVGELEF